MNKSILFLILTGIFLSCESDPELKGLPTIITGNASSIGYTTASVTYTIDNNTSVKHAGVAWDTKRTFDNNSHYVSGSTENGAHTIYLTSLPSGSTIYFKAYVDDGFIDWNDWSNTLYGEVKSFKTTNVRLPVVTTSEVSDILEFTANCGGTITEGSLTITERGICYNTTGSPTINDNKITTVTGSGTYTSKLTSLTPNTKHYVRAYAIDSDGNCVFGEVKSFTTIQQETGTFTDARDNVTYKWVKIGNQVWMAENLRATRYNDGTAIPNITSNTTWANLTTSAYCYYNNSLYYSTKYGCLYNWYAVYTGKLAPTGWHVPTDAEWNTLSDCLSGSNVSGGHLKSTSSWNSPNTEADNSSNFSALPGGCRNYEGFEGEGNLGCWWTSTLHNSTSPVWGWSLFYNGGYLGRYGYYRYYGFSVRCVRDN